VSGLALITSAVNVYIRDTRYVVESANTVLFWLVPIFYGTEIIPPKFLDLYNYNPVAALVVCLRDIFLQGAAPQARTMVRLGAVAIVTFAIGSYVFRKGKDAFYEHI